MPFQSPLSNLSDVLMQIKNSASQYRTTLTKNEAATRAVLVDPILRALGWDIANTNMVEVEKTHNNVRADYALYDTNQLPKIIVEAKSLGSNLSKSTVVMSLVNYAFNFKLNDVFLTDGLMWHHFNEFTPGKLQPTKILDIANDDPVLIAAYLVQHIDAAKFWPIEETIDVLAQRIDQLESTVQTLSKKFAVFQQPSFNPNKKQILHTAPASPPATMKKHNFIDLDKLDSIAGKKPSLFRLPDGNILDVRAWKDILRESCKFALENNPDIPIPFSDHRGKKISLFNTFAPAKGISYITEEYNGKTIYIYVNYDSVNCVENSLHVLKNVLNSVMKISPAVVLRK